MTVHRTTVAQYALTPFGPRYHWRCRCGSESRDTYRTPEAAHERAGAHVRRAATRARRST